MQVINRSDFELPLSRDRRIYLCGNLCNETDYKYITTDGFEMGITEYNEFTVEKAHYHKYNAEYNFVMKGMVKVYILDEKKEYLCKAGSIFVIEPGMTYKVKGVKDTSVIFSKVPGGNDKILVPECDDFLNSWASSWD